MRAKDRDEKIRMRKEDVKFKKGLLRAMPVKKDVAPIVAATDPRRKK